MFAVASHHFCACYVSAGAKLPPSACGMVRRRSDIVHDWGNVFISCVIRNGNLQVCENTLEWRSAAAVQKKEQLRVVMVISALSSDTGDV